MAKVLRLQPRGAVDLRAVPSEPVLVARELSVQAAGGPILRDVNLQIFPRRVHGVIGPSGAGKSTLLRCLNRLVDLDEGLRVEGTVEFLGRSVRARGVDVDELRSRVGIVFQQPVVFPRSIYENVIFGLRRLRRLSKRELRRRAETALQRVALWDEVRGRLEHPAAELSVGQRQRLCLARTLAVEPDVLLMDEPTSALDPQATAAIEELIVDLRRDHAIVLVTHDLEQARRVADHVGCVCLRDGVGELVENGVCERVFDEPQSPAAVEFLQRRSEP